MKKGKKQKKGLILVLAFVIIGVCVWYFLLSGDSLKGTWNYDDITMYQFNGKGKGALLLPENQYKFTYELTENEVFMNFADEQIQDTSYQYRFENDALVLFGSEGLESYEYKMEKVKR